MVEGGVGWLSVKVEGVLSAAANGGTNDDVFV